MPRAPASSLAVHASSLRSALISSGVTTPFDSTREGRVVSSLLAARHWRGPFAMRRIFVSMILVAALAWAATTSGCGGDSGDASDGSVDSFGIIQGGDGAG